MKYDPIPATPDIIRWTPGRAGFSLAEAKQTFENIEAWDAGETSLSYPRFEKLADKFNVTVAEVSESSPTATKNSLWQGGKMGLIVGGDSADLCGNPKLLVNSCW